MDIDTQMHSSSLDARLVQASSSLKSPKSPYCEKMQWISSGPLLPIASLIRAVRRTFWSYGMVDEES